MMYEQPYLFPPSDGEVIAAGPYDRLFDRAMRDLNAELSTLGEQGEQAALGRHQDDDDDKRDDCRDLYDALKTAARTAGCVVSELAASAAQGEFIPPNELFVNPRVGRSRGQLSTLVHEFTHYLLQGRVRRGVEELVACLVTYLTTYSYERVDSRVIRETYWQMAPGGKSIEEEIDEYMPAVRQTAAHVIDTLVGEGHKPTTLTQRSLRRGF